MHVPVSQGKCALIPEADLRRPLNFAIWTAHYALNRNLYLFENEQWHRLGTDIFDYTLGPLALEDLSYRKIIWAKRLRVVLYNLDIPYSRWPDEAKPDHFSERAWVTAVLHYARAHRMQLQELRDVWDWLESPTRDLKPAPKAGEVAEEFERVKETMWRERFSNLKAEEVCVSQNPPAISDRSVLARMGGGDDTTKFVRLKKAYSRHKKQHATATFPFAVSDRIEDCTINHRSGPFNRFSIRPDEVPTIEDNWPVE